MGGREGMSYDKWSVVRSDSGACCIIHGVFRTGLCMGMFIIAAITTLTPPPLTHTHQLSSL